MTCPGDKRNVGHYSDSEPFPGRVKLLSVGRKQPRQLVIGEDIRLFVVVCKLFDVFCFISAREALTDGLFQHDSKGEENLIYGAVGPLKAQEPVLYLGGTEALDGPVSELRKYVIGQHAPAVQLVR